MEREVAVLNVDAVDAYLAVHPCAPLPAGSVTTGGGVHAGGDVEQLVEPPPSRFDPMFADPEFWSDLAGQCAVYRPHAPTEFAEALTRLEEGARLFLAAVDGAS